MRTSPFTEEHDQLRASVRRWVESELAPHSDEWEAAGMFPDEVFRRAGELGFLGVAMPQEVGGSGGDYWTTVVVAEELPRCNNGSIPMGGPVGRYRSTAIPRSCPCEEAIFWVRAAPPQPLPTVASGRGSNA